MRPVPTQPGPALVVDGELHPRTPAEASGSTASTSPSHVDAGQPCELLAHDCRSSRAGPPDRRAGSRSLRTAARVRARRLDPARCRLDHLDGVGAQERLASLGDLDAHALAGQRVADEHDLPVEPGDAMAPVRDRPDVDDRRRATAYTSPEAAADVTGRRTAAASRFLRDPRERSW